MCQALIHELFSAYSAQYITWQTKQYCNPYYLYNMNKISTKNYLRLVSPTNSIWTKQSICIKLNKNIMLQPKNLIFQCQSGAYVNLMWYLGNLCWQIFEK